MAHAIALDYLWNDITPAQRTSLGNVIVAMTDELYAYSPHNIGFANPMSDYSNQLYYHLGAWRLRESCWLAKGMNDSRAQFYLSESAVLLNDHMIPAMNQEAGGDQELNSAQRLFRQWRLGRGYGPPRHDPSAVRTDGRGLAHGCQPGSVSTDQRSREVFAVRGLHAPPQRTAGHRKAMAPISSA